jgi:hypothetical protein
MYIKYKNLEGKKVNRLTFIKNLGMDGNNKTKWLCKCDCGKEISIIPAAVMNGNTKSCGCLKIESIAKRRFVDLSGKKIGKLTVIKRNGFSSDGHITWECKCECGKIVTRAGRNLTQVSVEAKSCGCCSIENLIGRNITRAKHLESNTRLYKVWLGMRNRCYCEAWKGFKNYGDRGIQVCDEWKDDYIPFRNWSLANGYTEELTIERKDVNGNYEPSNCRWATWAEQANNKRDSHMLVYKGKTQTMADWARDYDINYGTFRDRIYAGTSIEEAISHEKRNERLIAHNGKTQSLIEWAKEFNINYGTLKARLRKGWPIEKSLTEPISMLRKRKIS